MPGFINNLPLESNGGIAVNVQDQTTNPIIVNFNKVTNSTTMTADAAIDDYDIVVDSATGISVGSYIILFNPTAVRFMAAYAVNVVSTTITLDTPLDFAFLTGTFVDVAITNMNVDGSTTPQVFGLRGTGSPPGVELTVDITRIIFSVKTTSAVDLSKFANFAKLSNGLVLRKRDGTYKNIFNVKDNGEIAGIMYDWNPRAATNPSQGQDGFVSRLTFGGQSKIGVVIRLTLGEDLEFLVQDDLATAQGGETITEFKIVAEGHLVQN